MAGHLCIVRHTYGRARSRFEQSPLQKQSRRNVHRCHRGGGLIRSGWASGVTVGDYNNDGFEDIFVTYYGQNVLYRNNGNGTFTDVTQQAGLIYEAILAGDRMYFSRL